jgi:hypothetical protein
LFGVRAALFSLFCFFVACGGAVKSGEGVSDGGTTAGSSTGTGGAGGSSVDYAACGPTDRCVPALVGCCGTCGPLELSHFAGTNARYVTEFRAATCPMPLPCPDCGGYPNDHITARCAAGRCEAIDIRRTPEITGCSADTDCRVRLGLECCECSSTGAWAAIAVKGESALAAAVCPANFGCDACVPQPPKDLVPACVNGVCEIFVLL